MTKPLDVKKPILRDVRNRIQLRAKEKSITFASHWISQPTFEMVTKIGWPIVQPWAWSLWREGMLLGLRPRK